MLRLRPFKNQDAAVILGWIHNEETFHKWSGDRYQNYPASPEDMINKYQAREGADQVFPMTAFDEKGIVGHMVLRYTDAAGFTIVHEAKPWVCSIMNQDWTGFEMVYVGD